MAINVEQINYPNVKGCASIENGCVKVVNKFGGEIKYNSIQVFANHWRFIEEEKTMLKPAVITFIKHYLALNNIKLDNVDYIVFIKYRGFDEIEIIFNDSTITKSIELKSGLIDYSVIDDQEEYTLEQLGIR